MQKAADVLSFRTMKIKNHQHLTLLISQGILQLILPAILNSGT